MGGAQEGRSPRGEAAEPRIREAASPRIPWFFRLTVRVVLVIRTRSIQSVPLSFPTCRGAQSLPLRSVVWQYPRYLKLWFLGRNW